MAKKTKKGKWRTREHIIADLAFNHVERHALRCGYTMHRIVQDDGLDAIIRTIFTRRRDRERSDLGPAESH